MYSQKCRSADPGSLASQSMGTWQKWDQYVWHSPADHSTAPRKMHTAGYGPKLLEHIKPSHWGTDWALPCCTQPTHVGVHGTSSQAIKGCNISESITEQLPSLLQKQASAWDMNTSNTLLHNLIPSLRAPTSLQWLCREPFSIVQTTHFQLSYLKMLNKPRNVKSRGGEGDSCFP